MIIQLYFFTNRTPRYQVYAITKVPNRNEFNPNRYLVRGLNQLDLKIDDMGNNKIRIQNINPAEKDEKFINSGSGYFWNPKVSLSFVISILGDAKKLRHIADGKDSPYFAANFGLVNHYTKKY
ncbi:hypothetical protein UT300002_30790 [Clostridium perfringens]